MDIRERIEQDLKNHPVMLYMKGTKDTPMCGFSARAVEILKSHNVDFATFNILEDEGMRQGLKDYADWPTFPMLFIKGEFVGGCDIMTEMHQSGDLAGLLKDITA